MQWSSSSDGDSILTAYLTQQAPHLEQFTLLMGRRETPFLLPSNFGEYSPRLRQLELQRCNIDFRLPLFQRLETLSVDGIDAHRAPTAAKWLDILANMRHSLIAAIIVAFGSNFQEATSLEFGMGLDLTVSDSEESLLLDLLRKSESAELSLRLARIHHSATNRYAFNCQPT